MADFIHLHCHDEYSLLDGFGSPDEFANRARELNMSSIAITNHGNMDSVIKFQSACRENKINPIFGCELYIVQDSTIKEKGYKRSHITLLAQNDTGLQNLFKLITKSNLEGFYYKPRIDSEMLLNHTEGLIIMSACASTFVNESWGISLLENLIDSGLSKNIFFEAMPHRMKEQIELNKKYIFLSRKYKIKIIATNDCHYVNKGDNRIQEVLLAIQSKAKWKDKNRWKFDIDDLYVKTMTEMRIAFDKQSCLDKQIYIEALKNTKLVEEMCSELREIKEIKTKLPRVPNLKDSDEIEIKKLCQIGFDKKILSDKQKSKIENEYKDRLDFELDVIIKQGFCGYFLVVWELIKWCEDNDIMVGPGRGSSGGSLVCYLLNITKVDPLQFNLVFARFISPARIDFPDIDMDFEDIKRDMIRNHLEELYGKYNVAGVSTFMGLKGRGAIRDVGRVFDIPMVDVNKAASAIVVRSGRDFRSDYSIEDAFNTFEDGIAFKKKYSKESKIAMRIEGSVRGKGMHAAAMVVSEDNLLDGKRAPLCKGKDNHHMIAFDKKDIEHVGLMKLDVLGLNALTVLNETKKLVKKNHNTDIEFEKIPLDDKKCFKEFSKGNNTGCFQVGSLGLKRFCQQLGVDNFMMLVHASSLYRPGTLRSGMATEFIKRKRGKEKWKSKHPIIEELTKDTYGVILYQEQVMKFMYELGGLGWKTADTVRKVISKSQGVEQFQKFKKMFAEGCVKKGTLNKKTAEELWNELSSFGSYGFNLSHAVEYSMITYWDMWCKINYPEEFICASLTYGSDNKKADLIEEAIRIGLDVRPPKSNISKSHNWVVKDKILYCPFIEIKGFGDKTSAYAEINVKSLTKRFINILEDIKYNLDESIDDDEAERIKNYFSLSFCKDPARKVKPVIEKLNLNFNRIKNIDFNVVDKKYRYYFGMMTEVKFGYRQNVQKERKEGKGMTIIAGQADNLRGVYGNYKDDSDSCMLVFGSDIYNKKKYQIEHSTEQFLIAKGNIPSRAGSIQCVDAWFEDDLIGCNLKGLELNLIKEKRYRNKNVLQCKDCNLCDESKQPIMPTTGKYNIMIIGEAPGKDEDTEGKPFVGKAGKVLFKELEKYDYERKNFTVTNIVKCFPLKTRTPSKIHIKRCSKWISEEIEKIKPIMILALGNTCMKYFLDEESGIMAKSGTTEWNDKSKCWISWCIHPASVLYSPENKELFEKGIKNFVNKLDYIWSI